MSSLLDKYLTHLALFESGAGVAGLVVVVIVFAGVDVGVIVKLHDVRFEQPLYCL